MMEEEIYHVITSYYDDWFAINKVREFHNS